MKTSYQVDYFFKGEFIKIISKSDDGWWTGEKNGVKGHFPSMLVAGLNEEVHEEEEEEAEASEGAF